jgi:hypothetical protein
MPKIPRYTGTDVENPSRPEIEHFGNCDICGPLVDKRDLGQVMAHMHGREATDLTVRILASVLIRPMDQSKSPLAFGKVSAPRISIRSIVFVSSSRCALSDLCEYQSASASLAAAELNL